MRRFTRTPYYTGPNDPERGQVRGMLKLGETFVVETIGGRDGDLKPGDVPETTIPRGSRSGGPFLIEGILPGDWVSIHIIDLQPGPYGYYNNGGPFRGSQRYVAPVRDGFVHFPPDFVIPVRPMLGVVQLEPVNSPTYAWNHGGNMDHNSVRAGAKVHIRAQTPGGKLLFADAHAYMSDGELTGTGVEIECTATVRVDRSPGFPVGGPVMEDKENWYTCGTAIDWEEAIKVAWVEMVGLLAHIHNTNADHANLIVGTVADAIPGYAAGAMNSRGFPQGKRYATVQLAVPKSLKRTGQPYRH